MADHARAGQAVGVADRNRTAVDVQKVIRDTLGILECKTMAGTIHASDIALKGGHVSLSVVGKQLLTKSTGGDFTICSLGRSPELQASPKMSIQTNYALPTPAGKSLLIRSAKRLFCIAAP